MEIKVDEKSKQKLLQFISTRLPEIIKESGNAGLKEISLFVKREMTMFIKNGGQNWAERSNFARQYASDGGSGHEVTFRKKERKQPKDSMLFLMKYFRWKISNDELESSAFIDFRPSSDDEVEILKTIVQTGVDIQVSEKMRNAFSYTEKPLEKETNTISVPAREVGKPVFRRTNRKFYEKLVDAFYPEFKRLLNE